MQTPYALEPSALIERLVVSAQQNTPDLLYLQGAVLSRLEGLAPPFAEGNKVSPRSIPLFPRSGGCSASALWEQRTYEVERAILTYDLLTGRYWYIVLKGVSFEGKMQLWPAWCFKSA